MYFTGGYLVHHGILGMRWGRRNGPPYPLDYSDHTKAQKKYIKRNKDGSMTFLTNDDGSVTIRTGGSGSRRNLKDYRFDSSSYNIVRDIEKETDKLVEDPEKFVKKKGLFNKGVMNDVEKIGKKTKEASQNTQEAIQDVYDLVKIGKVEEDAKTLSNDDLRKYIDRMNLEAQYRNLKMKEPNVAVERTKKAVKIAGGAVATAGTVLVVGGTTYAVVKGLKENE